MATNSQITHYVLAKGAQNSDILSGLKWIISKMSTKTLIQ